jgi:hypothetical protein
MKKFKIFYPGNSSGICHNSNIAIVQAENAGNAQKLFLAAFQNRTGLLKPCGFYMEEIVEKETIIDLGM